MKYTPSITLFIASLLLAGCGATSTTTINTTEEPTTLTVYAYDSLTAEYGLLPNILKDFEGQNNTQVEVVSFSDTGSMLNQLILEKDAPKADIVMGLDNVDYVKASENNVLAPYTPERASDIPEDLWFDKEFTMTPFDYGYIGFVYDSEQITFSDPISLADLAGPAYADKIIIEQAGASSPGTQLLLWTNAALGEEQADAFWLNMSKNVFQVAPDWSTAYYTLFLGGEAPIVLSYLTSPAYHIDQEGTYQYKTIPIKEGYIRQVEGVSVVTGSDQPEVAGNFIDYILEDSVQNSIPTTQWMMPIFGDPSTWPQAYTEITIPSAAESLQVPAEDIKTNLPTWIQEYNTTFGLE